MAGKPTIPTTMLRRIRRLAAKGESVTAIMSAVSVSRTTVRKAVDPAFAERERERHRLRGAEQYAKRKDDPAYQDYQAAANSSELHRTRVRSRMAALRAARKASKAPPTTP